MNLMDLFVALKLDTSQYDQAVSGATEKTRGFGGVVQSIAGGIGIVGQGALVAGAAGAAALASTAGAAFALASNAAGAADEILALSAKTGISTTALQEMRYASEFVDVDLNTMTGSLTFLTRSMGAAASGSGEQAEIFDKLGVSIKNSDGSLRSANDVWGETIGKLGGMENATERNVMALSLFGRSAMELNPLLEAPAGTLETLAAEAHKVGAVMSEENVQAAGALDDAMQRVKQTISGVATNLGSQLAPAFLAVADGAGEYIGQIGAALTDSSQTAEERIGAVSGIVQSIAEDITAQIPALGETAVQVMTALVNGITASIPTLMPAVVSVMMGFVGFVITALPILIDGALQVVLALADGIVTALPNLIPAVIQAVLTIITSLLGALPRLIEVGLQAVVALVEGIIAALPVIIEQLPVIIQTIVTTIITALPLLLDAAVKIIVALVDGLVTNLPVLAAAIPVLVEGIVRAIFDNLPAVLGAGVEVVKALADAIIKLVPALWDAGVALITGLWNGIKSLAGSLVSGVTDICEDIMGAITGFFGIHSPAARTEWAAENIMQGLINPLKDTRGLQSALGGIFSLFDMGGLGLSVPVQLAPAASTVGAAGAAGAGSLASSGLPGQRYPTADEIGLAVRDAILQVIGAGGVR